MASVGVGGTQQLKPQSRAPSRSQTTGSQSDSPKSEPQRAPTISSMRSVSDFVCLRSKDEEHKPGHWKSRKVMSLLSRRGTNAWFWKWLLPWAFGGFGFYMQSSLLHYATYRYVHRIHLQKEHSTVVNWNWSENGKNDGELQALDDPLAAMFGEKQPINLKFLDSVAAFFPAAFVAISMYCGAFAAKHDHILSSQCLQVWTKVFVCAGILFILKGSLGAMTTVPDSSGWQVCKDRLAPAGIKYMEEEHTFWEMFSLDYHWHFAMHNPHPLRYCSDMMYSGHTFVVTLFALGFYEIVGMVWKEDHTAHKQKQLRKEIEKVHKEFTEKHTGVDATEENEYKNKLKKMRSNAWLHEKAPGKSAWKAAFLTIWALFAMGEQMIEIYFVLLSRFHYSMDVVMALVVTFLLYTNGAVAVAAKQWELRGTNLFIPRWFGQLFPYFKNSHYPTRIVKDDDGLDLQVSELPTRPDWRQLEMWSTRGDIYVPVCCFPFCCLAGRQHIYSDSDMKSIGYCLNTITGNPCAMNFDDLREEWNLDEGVSGQDVADMVAAVAPCWFKETGASQPRPRAASEARELSGLQEPLVGSEAVAEAV